MIALSLCLFLRLFVSVALRSTALPSSLPSSLSRSLPSASVCLYACIVFSVSLMSLSVSFCLFSNLSGYFIFAKNNFSKAALSKDALPLVSAYRITTTPPYHLSLAYDR